MGMRIAKCTCGGPAKDAAVESLGRCTEAEPCSATTASPTQHLECWWSQACLSRASVLALRSAPKSCRTTQSSAPPTATLWRVRRGPIASKPWAPALAVVWRVYWSAPQHVGSSDMLRAASPCMAERRVHRLWVECARLQGNFKPPIALHVDV